MFPSSFAPVSVVVGCVDGSWGPVEPMANQGALSLRAVGLHYGQVAFEGLRAVSIDGRLHVFRPDLHHRRLARSLERLSMPAVPGPVLGGALAALLDRVAIPEDLGPGWFLYLRPLVVAVDEDWSMSGGRQFELHVLTGWTAPAFHDVPEIRALADSAGRRALSGRAGVVKVPANYGSAMPAQHRARSVGAYTVLWLTPGSRVVEEFTSMNALVVVDGVLHAPAPEASGSERLIHWQGEDEVSLPEWGGVLRFEPAGEATRGEGFDPDWLRAQPLAVRVRGGGERFKPHPTRPSKTLKRLFQDAGIAEFERAALPLVWRGDRLIFVAGLGPDVRLIDADGPRVMLAWRAHAGLIAG